MQEEVDLALEQLRPGDGGGHLQLDAASGAAGGVARAVRGGSRHGSRGRAQRRRRVRVGAVLLRAGLPAADAARAVHAVRAHDAARAAAGRAHIRRDRAPARERASAGRTSSRCCWTPATRTGEALERKHIRDEVMTLLFAGHDTTTSTVAFMFYELARNPQVLEDPGVERGDDRRRDAAQVPAGLHRAAPLRGGIRVRRLHGSGARARALLLVGKPPPAGRVSRAGAVHSAALQRGEQGEASAGRLRARSAEARAPASACGSARRRSPSSHARSWSATGWSSSPATSCRSATLPRSRRGRGCR